MKLTLNDIESVKFAIMDGLDPNTRWTEEVLVRKMRKSGCVMPILPSPLNAWQRWNTPLHRALDFSDFETAEFLLQHGADVNLHNAAGKTPLHEAVSDRRYDAIRFLLTHNANVNISTVGACIRSFRDDIIEIAGKLAIQQAFLSSDLTSVQVFVQAGVDLCPPSQRPWSALDLALLYGDRMIVELLRTQGHRLPEGGPHSLKEDYRDSSRDLLDFSRDNNPVPPKELYGTYGFVLGRIDTAPDVDVETLMGRICTSYQDFQQRARIFFETETSFDIDLQSKRKDLNFTFKLHPSRQHLIDSASSGCAICAIILDALDQYERNSRLSSPVLGREDFGPNSDTVKLRLARLGLGLNDIIISCGELDLEIRVSHIDDSLTSSFKDSFQADTSTGSSNAMEVAKNWIRICQENHAECQEARSGRQRKGILPRRLLQVGSAETQPHIVHVQGTVPYCALSYCWGAKDFFTTKRETLVQSMSGILMESFPTIMRDGISVVRSLEYEYIWIDALCIVQDDEQDWAHEAAIMGDIYSNAELTISTLVSGDCHTGLFQPRSARVMHPVPLAIWEPKILRKANASLSLMPCWLRHEIKVDGLVHSRGWTLQEQLLSTRILYFGDGMLHFECLHDYAVEAKPNGDIQQMRIPGSNLEDHDLQDAMASLPGPMAEDLRR
ncbi:heterokaryon incompatibility protein [Fusarium langsethiae]|uniref:Heterokaryon incompatibility protein n=1 Tax=Fusarium langsethiae TaxID=179993 RepID=A0A0M9EMU5_FUSLA|nr:heterokaryon incompatibility protein [Fusarium langsethiae]GKU06374.1 unnamed protein product [Fusarium langsethiae]GKU23117.1 unnamed protein product [Fusarium langsethiae]